MRPVTSLNCDCKAKLELEAPMSEERRMRHNSDVGETSGSQKNQMGQVTSRSDIAYAVNFMSQFNSCYTIDHWKAAKRILRYLSGTKTVGLIFKQTGDDLYGVVDVYWGGNLTDRRSYSG
nr:secreted RxLR effector protein 161-like [Drosophila bipectinata]